MQQADERTSRRRHTHILRQPCRRSSDFGGPLMWSLHFSKNSRHAFPPKPRLVSSHAASRAALRREPQHTEHVLPVTGQMGRLCGATGRCEV
ncbi:hypothetical protein EYF80_060544 [Liparis tanakae]|uniref:Uncharacterized protein n=1 Tax=Liparis tanakae TaxID=230148 RepID=A0A4Z2EKS2_9TELE|nr:hypothetical protein EYF80_060544 [Liparis tanakae]